jgi:surfactin synthase thioesterase subunit
MEAESVRIETAPQAKKPKLHGEWLSIPVPLTAPNFRLFAFPHAGGDGSAFRDFALGIADAGIEVWTLRLPGRGARRFDSYPSDFMQMITHVATEISEVDDLPYGFYGQSLGALVAYEVAVFQEMRRQQPSYVMLANSPTPKEWFESASTGTLVSAEEVMSHLSSELPAELLHPELHLLAVNSIRSDLELVQSYDRIGALSPNTPVRVIVGEHDFISHGHSSNWGIMFPSSTVTTWPGAHLLFNHGERGPTAQFLRDHVQLIER